MNIPQFDQDLATLKAFETQWRNGYHLSEDDIKQFYASMERLKQFEQLVNGKDTTL